MIEHTCQSCGKLLRIPDEYRGTSGRCNGCNAPVCVPASALTAVQQSVIDVITKPPRDEYAPPKPSKISTIWTKVNRPRVRPQRDKADELIAAQRAHTRAMNSNFSCLIIVLLVLFCPIWIPIVLVILGGLLALGG